MTDADAKKPYPGWLPMALDYGPLILFFAVFKFVGIFAGTAAFMVAILAAVIISRWKIGRISPMMWLSAVLVVGFGGLTLWLRDERFIQIKPTAVYALLSALLFIGLLRGKPLLKYVLEHGFQGLTEQGWLLLSRNWAWFFAFMALLNEAMRATLSFDTWLTLKVWALIPLSMLFGIANVPMLMKHGLGEEEEAKAG
jgi:intracellular septation protein